MRYYGLDWLMFGLILLHLWCMGNKWRIGWIVASVNSCVSMIFGYLVGSPALIIMNVVFICFHIRNFLRWSNFE